MNITFTMTVTSACLFVAAFIGLRLRLPDDHMKAETRDAVQLSAGLVATMTAVVLGLLISSVKSAYDIQQNEIGLLAAKSAILDRLLIEYGPETGEIRAHFRETIEHAVERIWNKDGAAKAGTALNTKAGDSLYASIANLSPKNALQNSIKSQAESISLELGQVRMLLLSQRVSSILTPMLAVIVSWLVFIILAIGLLTPTNSTGAIALMGAVFAMLGAVLLILELDHPFEGLIQIPSEPLINVLAQFTRESAR